MKKLDRFIAAVLTCAMIFSCLPVSAFAAYEWQTAEADILADDLADGIVAADDDEETADAAATLAVAADDDTTTDTTTTAATSGTCGANGDNLTWVLDGTTLTISGTGKIADYAYANSKPWDASASTISNIVIEDGVTSIGNRAFEHCTALISIDLPKSLTRIGYSTFYGCTSLTSIDLPDGLTSIGGYAFYKCTSLTRIDFPDGLTSISNYAFSDCTSLTSIDFPDGLTSISDYAFSDCTSLTSIDLPDSLTSIGEGVFSGCTNLTSINLPDSLTSISGEAFWKCTSLASIDLPDGLTSIGGSAFDHCTSLTSIDLPDGLTSIDIGTFYGCTSLASINLPDSLTSIDTATFYGCTSLTSINLPDGLTSIGDYAFYKCTSLTRIDFPDGLTSISNYAFSDCTSLTSIDLPDGLTSIGRHAFEDCTSLTSINLPDGLTAIGKESFSGCTNLSKIIFTGDRPTFDDDCFNGVTATVYYPNTWTEVPSSTLGGAKKITWVPYDPATNPNPGGTTVDPSTCEHTNTTIVNAKAATETEDGYTGDTKCLDCGEIITAGTVIPATGKKDDTPDESSNYFKYGIDNFNFLNSDFYFGIGEADSNGKRERGERYVSDEDLKVLLTNLEESDLEKVAEMFAKGKTVENLRANNLENWNGSCYGMEITMAFFKEGILNAGDWPDVGGDGAEYTSKIVPIGPNENEELKSLINIYHMLQTVYPAPAYNALTNPTRFSNVMQEMWDAANNVGVTTQQPFIISLYNNRFLSRKKKGHVVLCYGAETRNESISWTGMSPEYDKRLKVIDSNSIITNGSAEAKKEFEEQYIYISENFDKAYYSGDEAYCSADKTYRLEHIDEIYTYFGYSDATLDEIAAIDADNSMNRRTRLDVSNMEDFSFSSDGKTTVISDGEIVSNDLNAGVYGQTDSSINGSESDDETIASLIIEGNHSSCTVASSNDTAFDATVYFNDVALTVNGTATSATYNDDGTVTVKGAEGDIEISAAVNDGNLSFASVTGDASGDVTVKFGADSVAVSGDIDNVLVTNSDIEGNESEIELDDKGTAYADANGTLTTKKEQTTPTNPSKKDDPTTPSGGDSSGAGAALAVGALAVGAVAVGGVIASMMPEKATLPDSSALHVTAGSETKTFTATAKSKTVTIKSQADAATLTGPRAYLEQLSAQGYTELTFELETSAKEMLVIPVTKKTTLNINEVLGRTPSVETFTLVIE